MTSTAVKYIMHPSNKSYLFRTKISIPDEAAAAIATLK